MYYFSDERYETMIYNRCGTSGLKLPALSLGFWHNFGGVDARENGRAIARKAFDLGMTHFDLANNYGPPAGSAEEFVGELMKTDFHGLRDELVISSKAGYYMWPGPYGDGGSRKYLISSLDASLVRMGLDYVDIFYHHRPDPHTPLEETMRALDAVVRQGKALYVGVSNYPPELTRQAVRILNDMGTPFIIHQPKYSMLDRWIEDGLLDVLKESGLGCITFSPLAQGLLTDRYLNGIPIDSRAAKEHGFLSQDDITETLLGKIRALNELADRRGQSLAQMALVWNLRHEQVTSVLVGASRVEQLQSNVKALENAEFTDEELEKINQILEDEE
ncbi:MAG: L-glyceraldehyde 3-phosphate reductase [candidate division KSB1 bacterium]|nr:L-glyceraldehyde 3-phosphate reductase [candidate division KSB1 bacterium]